LCTGEIGGFYSNKLAVELAEKHDMGVFIISPSDKGGQLYMPPKKFADACEPAGLSPIEFNNLWLLCDPAIHTLVVGAAFPSDFDAHVNSVLRYEERRAIVPPVEERLNAMLIETVGAKLLAEWSKGLPDVWGNIDGKGNMVQHSNNPKVLNFTQIMWMWIIAKSWDMVGFGRYRYKQLESNAKNWDDAKSDEENWTKQEGSWNPGMPLPEGGLEEEVLPLIKGSSHQKRVLEALTEARDMFKSGSEYPLPPYAYDMRPEVEWPLRPK
jgi:predicted aldo/keto reductase-like oxidoreductase